MKLYYLAYNEYVFLMLFIPLILIGGILQLGIYFTGDEYFYPRALWIINCIYFISGAMREYQIIKLAERKRRQYHNDPEIDALIPPNTRKYIGKKIFIAFWSILIWFVAIFSYYFEIDFLVERFYIWNIPFYIFGKPIPNLIIIMTIYYVVIVLTSNISDQYPNTAILKNNHYGASTPKKQVLELLRRFPD